MFDRLTDQARYIISRAKDHASEQGEQWLGVEHLAQAFSDAAGDPSIRASQVLNRLRLNSIELVRQTTKDDNQIEAQPWSTPYTPRLARTFARAHQIALHLGSGYIGSEHLLAGLAWTLEELHQPRLRPNGLSFQRVVDEIKRESATTEDAPAGPFEPAAKTTAAVQVVEELARNLAAQEGSDVTTAHYLLALLAESNGIAARVLQRRDVDWPAVQAELTDIDKSETSDATPLAPPKQG